MASQCVLILEADRKSGIALRDLVAECDYQAVLEQNFSAAIDRAGKLSPSVIVVGNSASATDSFDLLRELRTQLPDIPVVLLTDKGSIEMAVRAIQEEGAYHYFEKPVDADRLRLVLDRAVELGDAKRENVTPSFSCTKTSSRY